MNKKQIIIIAGVGLIFFALSFTVGLFTRKPKEAVADGKTPEDAQVVKSPDGSPDAIDQTWMGGAATANNFQAKQANFDKSLTIKQLNSLIFEMRSKLTEFTIKEKMLDEKEARVQMAIDELHKNIKALEELRVKLAVTVSSIKQQQTVLDERLLIIEEIERTNLQKNASIYDKMKAQQSAEIMINLIKQKQLDSVVKLAYYMTERTSANMLAEINKKEPELAATISDKLRWIEEVKP
ncbi:MAG: hypothetical protein FVQ82_01120 [Planctomycetes bacterium]|nr:hypothetical protein [Planctomycetota bacterium]